jgi:hypothetical protein
LDDERREERGPPRLKFRTQIKYEFHFGITSFGYLSSADRSLDLKLNSQFPVNPKGQLEGQCQALDEFEVEGILFLCPKIRGK